MNLVLTMVARNSDWCIGLTLRAALMWVDQAVVLLHNCTDGTEEIVMQISLETERLVVLIDNCAEWEEMRLRQSMLDTARGIGATHIAIVDDDEILTGDLLGRIRQLVESISPGSILMLPWLQLQNGIGRVMVTGMWAHQSASTAFPDMPVYHWTARDGYDLHHRHPMGAELHWNCPISDRSSGLMHLQFASRRRLHAKQFLYQLVEMKRWPNRRPVDEVRRMYHRTVNEAFYSEGWPVPLAWWDPYEDYLVAGSGGMDLMQYLHIDREPWQEAECRRLLAENPGLAVGLDDFGLMKEWGL